MTSLSPPAAVTLSPLASPAARGIEDEAEMDDGWLSRGELLTMRPTRRGGAGD